MISLAAVWLFQDLLQVLAMGIVLIPEFFLMRVAYEVVSGSMRPERISALIWLAFAGGIIWDVRWVTTPGMSGLVNALSVLAVYAVWNRTPTAGRGVLLFGVLAGSAHFLSGAVHYFAWAVPGGAALRLFLIQQLLGAPVVLLFCLIMAFRETRTRV